MCRVINRSSFFSPVIKSFFIKLICPHRHFKVVPPLALSFNAGGSNPLRVQRKTLYSSRAQHPCPLVLAALCIKAEGNFRLHVGCANTHWTSGIIVPCATTRPGSMAQFHYNQIRNASASSSNQTQVSQSQASALYLWTIHDSLSVIRRRLFFPIGSELVLYP